MGKRSAPRVRAIWQDALGLLHCPWCPAVIRPPDKHGHWWCARCGALGVVLATLGGAA